MLQAVLKVVGGKQDGNLIPLSTKKFLIGREQDCHLRPGSESVSRHHCAINIDDFGVRIRDLGSSNGTLVNGTRIIGAQEVRAGDRIKIGSLEFELLVSSEGVPVGADESTSETAFSLNDFELDEVNDTAVMSGDTAVIDTRQTKEPIEVPAAEVSVAESPEAPPEEAVSPPVAEPQPVAAESPQPAQEAVPQPALDPAAQMNPQPGMPQPGMPYPAQQMPGYPGMPMPGMPQPGYPYGMPPQPGYGMPAQPQYGMPYPQQPGYPPQQPGYPPQQPGYPPQQPMPYPAQPAPLPIADEEYEEEYDDDDDDGDGTSGPPVSLPDPSETGLKDEPKAKDEDGKPSAPPPNPAEEVLKKYTNRR
jgi:pSer/pThr/pTyr-binding forkhead associated (FHA) protein